MNITCIGHITRDKIVTPLQTTYMAGGTTTYVALGINALTSKSGNRGNSPTDFKLIASLSNNDIDIIQMMRDKGIDVDTILSRETTFFENIYGENNADRKQNVRSVGDPFTIEKLTEHLEPLRKLQERPYIILGSLLADDFPLEVVSYCKEIGHVVMDAQGYFREVVFQTGSGSNRIGKVKECEWKDKAEFLENIDVLKLNENEARLITNEEDLHIAAKQLHELGIKEVLLTLGRFGSIVAANGEVIDIPVVPEIQSIDATGCGDTYVMAYIYQRSLGSSPKEAGLFASAAATIKLEGNGPLQVSEEEVSKRIVRF